MDIESARSKWLSILAAIAVFSFFGVFMADVPAGPKKEFTGVVEIAGINAASKSVPHGVVRVRLDDGSAVSATVLPGVVALSGDQVRIRVYERVLTQTLVYEVYARESDAAP